LTAIADALVTRGVRLLTLTGPGGVGKTRLAIEVAREVGDRFADGVVFVRLDGLSNPALVLPALAGALHVLEIGGARPLGDRVAAHLSDREVLIILDNMEHLLPAAGELADLVRRVPQIRILVTSRESLRVGSEHVVSVAPLPRPDPAAWQQPAAGHDDSPAIDLFVRRALAVRPDLPVDPATESGRANLTAIAEICHRLDGLPLAIELAAAQAQLLSPAAILSLLENAAPPLFAGAAPDRQARFPTMDAAIAWSYDLLTPAEQALLRALAVFASGFTLPAAAAVIGVAAPGAYDPVAPGMAAIDTAFLGDLATLARKNLLSEDTAAAGPAPRFRMLEPIRLFALDRLRESGEEVAVRYRHAVFFTGLAEKLDALTLGPDPELWLRQQVVDFDNFHSALDWTVDAGESDLTVRLTCFIAQLWEIKGLISEARQRVARAIAVDSAATPEHRWFLRFWAGTFALDQGDIEGAIAHARDLQQIAERHGERIGFGVGHALLSRAVGAFPDRHEEAADLARQAVEILEPLGSDEWTGCAWIRLGIEYHVLGRLAESRASLLKSLEFRRRKLCEGCVAYSLVALGAVSLDLGEADAALDAYQASFDLTVKQGNQSLLLAVLLGLADVARRCGVGPEPERTALLFFGAAEALRRRHGFGRRVGERQAIARWLNPIRAALGYELAEAYIAEGAALSLAEVGAIANELELTTPCPAASPDARPVSLLAAHGSIE
jgi:predicted ATPase